MAVAIEVVAGAGSEVVPMEVETGAGSEVVSMEVEAGAGSEVVAMEVEAEEPVMEMKEAAEAAEADCSAGAAQSATEEHPLAPVMSRRGLLQ